MCWHPDLAFNGIDVCNVSSELKVKYLKGKRRESNFKRCRPKEKREFGGVDERREIRRIDTNRQHAVCLAGSEHHTPGCRGTGTN